MNLDDLREKIDEIDDGIVSLYKERMAISKLVADYKISTGKAVHDPAREKEKIAVLTGKAETDFDKNAIAGLFSQIMSVSRKLQYRLLAEKANIAPKYFKEVPKLETLGKRVVFQGAEGAFSQEAMESYFGTDVDSFNVETFKDVMLTLSDRKADFAVLPLENSTAGYVSEVFDLLALFDNYIVAEQEILIEHNLMVKKGTRFEDIETVYSHPMSLLQSAEFLAEYPQWKKIPCENNAFAARLVADSAMSDLAAIAGRKAAEIYGLEILQAGINQSATNATRFIIVSNDKMYRHDAKTISICFEVPHQSGSLYQMLSHFIFNDLNMTRIESRPIPEHDWEYRFFVDFEGNLSDSAVKNALHGLSHEAVNLKILGNY